MTAGFDSGSSSPPTDGAAVAYSATTEIGAAGVEVDGLSTDEREDVALFGRRIDGVEQHGAGADV